MDRLTSREDDDSPMDMKRYHEVPSIFRSHLLIFCWLFGLWATLRLQKKQRSYFSVKLSEVVVIWAKHIPDEVTFEAVARGFCPEALQVSKPPC
jgi:hypothetical protein